VKKELSERTNTTQSMMYMKMAISDENFFNRFASKIASYRKLVFQSIKNGKLCVETSFLLRQHNRDPTS